MKVKRLQLKRIIKEEVLKLLEQPNVSPTRHSPSVAPTGAKVITVDSGDIDRLDAEIASETEDDQDLIKKAEEVGVDPLLVGDFQNISAAFLQALMDYHYEMYRAQNLPGPPAVAEE